MSPVLSHPHVIIPKGHVSEMDAPEPPMVSRIRSANTLKPHHLVWAPAPSNYKIEWIPAIILDDESLFLASRETLLDIQKNKWDLQAPNYKVIILIFGKDGPRRWDLTRVMRWLPFTGTPECKDKVWTINTGVWNDEPIVKQREKRIISRFRRQFRGSMDVAKTIFKIVNNDNPPEIEKTKPKNSAPSEKEGVKRLKTERSMPEYSKSLNKWVLRPGDWISIRNFKASIKVRVQSIIPGIPPNPPKVVIVGPHDVDTSDPKETIMIDEKWYTWDQIECVP